MPRRYSKEKRQVAVDETRARIVQATMELHHEKGIVATSFDEIAERAGVATATVYRHFPSLELLVGACGQLTAQVIRPPQAEDAPRLFAGARALTERVERLVAEMAQFYQRSHRSWVIVLRDVEQLEPLRHFLNAHRSSVEAYVREALKPLGDSIEPETIQVVCALMDFPMWQSLADRRLKEDQIIDELCRLVFSCVKRRVSKV